MTIPLPPSSPLGFPGDSPKDPAVALAQILGQWQQRLRAFACIELDRRRVDEADWSRVWRQVEAELPKLAARASHGDEVRLAAARLVGRLARRECTKGPDAPGAPPGKDGKQAAGDKPPEDAPGEKTHHDLMDAYEDCLSTLPREQRRVLGLRVVLGLPFHLVAEELRLSADFAAMLVERAWRKLQDCMRAKGFDC